MARLVVGRPRVRAAHAFVWLVVLAGWWCLCVGVAMHTRQLSDLFTIGGIGTMAYGVVTLAALGTRKEQSSGQ